MTCCWFQILVCQVPCPPRPCHREIEHANRRIPLSSSVQALLFSHLLAATCGTQILQLVLSARLPDFLPLVLCAVEFASPRSALVTCAPMPSSKPTLQRCEVLLPSHLTRIRAPMRQCLVGFFLLFWRSIDGVFITRVSQRKN